MFSGAIASVLLPLPDTIRTTTATTTYGTTTAATADDAADVAVTVAMVVASDGEDSGTSSSDWRSSRSRLSSSHFGYKSLASFARAQF